MGVGTLTALVSPGKSIKDSIKNGIQKESKLIELEPRQYIEKDTGILINDIDVGQRLDVPSIMKKSEYFVRNYLKHLWVKEDKPREKMLDSAKAV